MGLTLVLGGARSGKSAVAERLAAASGRPVRYLATADASDPAMAERIRGHRRRRPSAWATVEAGERLAADALGHAAGLCVLVDGLGVWVAGRLHAAGALEGTGAPAHEARIREEVAALAAAAARRPEPTLVVCEEAGLGVLPASAGARRWVDVMGDCAQALAARADRVLLVVAGRVLEMPRGELLPADRPAAPCPPRVHGDAMVPAGAVDHAVNVMSGGPPPWLRVELRRALEERAGAYPRETEAVEALAARHGRSPQEVVPANGATQALWLLAPALRPRLAACVHPGFTEPEAAFTAHGVPVARVVRDAARDFALEPGAVPVEADVVVIANPGSPAGTLDAADALMALRRPGRVLVVDEAFMDLVPGEGESLAGVRLEDVVVVRSVTKSLAVPGLRAGYALASPAVADRLRAVRPPWSVNALALAAMTAWARRPEAAASVADRSRRECDDLAARLARLPGIRVWPGAANFLLVEVPDGAAVAERLLTGGIAVRPCGDFPGLGAAHLRLTARAPEGNARLADALAAAVA